MKCHNGFPLMKEEWKHIFQSRKFCVTFFVVMFIPLLYAGLFLYSFWDPYARLDRVPVAVVNTDQGAVQNGKRLEIGAKLVQKLEENPKFAWDFVSKTEAESGMDTQKYYAMIEIPTNFSQKATTITQQQPEQLQLKVSLNEGFNFLAAQIGETGMQVISDELSATITETYVKAMVDGLSTLVVGIDLAENGSAELEKGTIKLQNGTENLTEKFNLYKNKMIEFETGVGILSQGMDNLSSGIRDLNQGLNEFNQNFSRLLNGSSQVQRGTEELIGGIYAWHNGAKEIENNLPNLTQGAMKLSEGSNEFSIQMNGWIDSVNEVATGMDAWSTDISELKIQMENALAGLPEEQMQQIISRLTQLEMQSQTLTVSMKQVVSGADALSEAANDFSIGAQNVSSGVEQFVNGISMLVQTSDRVAVGAESLLTAQKSLHDGLVVYNQSFQQVLSGGSQVFSGANQVSTGMTAADTSVQELTKAAGSLYEGIGVLADGTQALHEGAVTLNQGLQDGANEAKAVTFSDKAAKMTAQPVMLETQKLNKVPNYGTGFAPYFISLGLFVGALVLSVVFPFKESVGRPLNAMTWFFSKFQVVVGAAVIQTALILMFVLFALDLYVASIPYFVLSTFVTSLAFLCIVQALVIWLGDPGRFVAILILILQLTTCGGTFPIETVPSVMQIFHPILPMTYSVTAMKAAISLGDAHYVFQSVGILMGFAIVFAFFAFLYFQIHHKKTFGFVKQSVDSTTRSI